MALTRERAWLHALWLVQYLSAQVVRYVHLRRPT